MTDDIVTRLRHWAFGTWSPPVKPLMMEAADEIERLRAELDNLKAENQRLSKIASY